MWIGMAYENAPSYPNFVLISSASNNSTLKMKKNTKKKGFNYNELL